MKAYVDSSVILRIIFGEKEALKFPSHLNDFAASEILKIECFRTLDRIQRLSRMEEDEIAIRYSALHSTLRHLRFIKLTEGVSQRSCEAFPVILKTLDAIHLSSAILWQQQEEEEILFLTHDLQLSKAAISLGFNVLGV